MDYVAIVTVLALVQVHWFGIQVGRQRAKHSVSAPAISGPPEFERMFRVHQNTIEQVVVFSPAMWLFATYWRPDVAAGLGIVFMIGRQMYCASYVKEPKSRGTGFVVSFIPVFLLAAGALVGAIMNLL